MSTNQQNIAVPPTMSGKRSTEADLQLRLLLTKLRKHKWRILAAALLATAVAALVVWSLLPIYRAKASILFESSNRGQIIEFDEVLSADDGGSEYLLTQVEILRSRQLAANVARAESLNEHWEFNSELPIPDRYRPTGPIAPFVNEVASSIGGFYRGTIARVNTLLGRAEDDEGTIVVEPAIDQAGEAIDPEAAPEDTLATIEVDSRLVTAVMARTKVVQFKGTNLVRVNFDSADPALAASVANAFGREYVAATRSRKAGLTDEASGWLSERLEVLRTKLDDAESALLEFREENGLVDFNGEVGGLNEQQIGIVTTELIDARREMQEARALVGEVNAARLVGTEVLEQIPAIAVDPGVQRYRITLQETERELTELRNRYLDRHPRVVDARSNLETAEQNLQRHVLSLADQIEKRYRIAQANVASLEGNLAQEKGEIQSLGRKQLQLMELEREVEINADLYERFFNRARETEEAKSLTSANASIVDPASVPQEPVKPKKTLVLFAVFTLTTLAASGLVFALEDFKDTIQGIHDVETKLGLNVLGVVPALRGSADLVRPTETHALTPRRIKDGDGRFIESMRTLRTSIRLLDEAGDCRKIMVTSSVPGEGKSTIASNLAQSLAKTERVLLIEADMRRPGISQSLHLRGPGFANLLRSEVAPSQCIHRKAIEGVDLLAAGDVDEDSPELLLSPHLGPMLQTFGQHYDSIVIDSAPVQAVSDALILGQFADQTLFVVKADDTSSAIVSRAVKRLLHHDIKICGAVISQVDFQQVSRYGGDYYYQGYFDKYGYGENLQHDRVRAA